jgi:hypothetical protein
MLNDKEVLISMKKNVSKALAIKKALGQYVVAWDSEKKQVKRIEAKDLPEYAYKESYTNKYMSKSKPK